MVSKGSQRPKKPRFDSGVAHTFVGDVFLGGVAKVDTILSLGAFFASAAI